jgi:ketosteroid isomerase-like protein
MRAFTLAIMLIVMCVVSVGQTGKMSKAEQAIRNADKAWSQAAQSKDLDKTVSFYADDASVLPFNAPIATGKDQIKQVWSSLMSKPGFSLTFAPTKMEIAKSGDLAYEVGTFELKVNDAQGNPTTTPGKYVVTWKRLAKGDWKAELDIFNTDK